jgi:hypothetical protein
MPRWPSQVRREPGVGKTSKLVVLCTSGVQISLSAFIFIFATKPRDISKLQFMEI